jgi:TolB protein
MKRACILAGLCGAMACSGSKTGGETLPPVTMISPDSANHLTPRFSPDWSRIYWWQPAGVGNELWTSGIDFKSPTRLPLTSITGTNPAFWSPDGSQLAVASRDTSGSGVAALTLMSADGSNIRHIALGSQYMGPLSWNADGDRILVFSSTGGTFHSFVTSLKHGGLTPMIPGETRPSYGIWSPDGSHIEYQLIDKGKNTIWVADSDGTHPRQLTTDGFESTSSSDTPWSPDGRTIAYESRRTGTADIWVVSIDSGAPRQLTHDVRNDTWPTWSPDGKWIAFLSDRGKQTDIWVVAASGGTELRVTDDAFVEEPMQWRPGTKQFAYLTGRGTSSIWSISLADSSEHQLTPDSILAGPPKLSPDGKQVAIRIDHGGGITDIALMPVAGGPMRTLVAGGANSDISWSPDGAHLAFISDRGGTPDLWVADVATGALRQLDNWPSTELGPVWSGDGSSLYFLTDHDARLDDVWRVPLAGGEPVRVTTQGAMSNLVTYRGAPILIGAQLNGAGQFASVIIQPDGKLTTLWDRTNSVPVDILPAGDSAVVLEIKQSNAIEVRIVPVKGGGEGRPIGSPNELFAGFSVDGKQMLYSIPDGATHDIGIENRADGTTRRLTKTAADESSPILTPDGKTVLFLRTHAVRRIAVADLTKLLSGTPPK